MDSGFNQAAGDVHAVEDISDIMQDVDGHLGHARLPRCLDQLLVQGLQLCFPFFALGNVVSQSGQPSDPALAIVQRYFGHLIPVAFASLWIHQHFLAVVNFAPFQHALFLNRSNPGLIFTVAFSHGIFGSIDAKGARVGQVIDDHFAIHVFYKEMIWQVVNKGAQ